MKGRIAGAVVVAVGVLQLTCGGGSSPASPTTAVVPMPTPTPSVTVSLHCDAFTVNPGKWVEVDFVLPQRPANTNGLDHYGYLRVVADWSDPSADVDLYMGYYPGCTGGLDWVFTGGCVVLGKDDTARRPAEVVYDLQYQHLSIPSAALPARAVYLQNKSSSVVTGSFEATVTTVGAVPQTPPRCGTSGPGPTPTPQPNATPTPTTGGTVALTGVVTAGGAGTRVSGARITVLDGPNAGRTASTTTNGDYRFDNLTGGNANLSASANGYVESRAGVFINGSNTLNFTLQSLPFSKTGTGDTVFDMPNTVSRIRIQASYGGRSSNFIVKIAGRLIVNEIIGTSSTIGTTFEGTYVTNGGVVEITNSSGVSWAFTQVQ